ncbi:hypothetical protein YB2330_002790 [Saitoella coloradoensis]
MCDQDYLRPSRKRNPKRSRIPRPPQWQMTPAMTVRELVGMEAEEKNAEWLSIKGFVRKEMNKMGLERVEHEPSRPPGHFGRSAHPPPPGPPVKQRSSQPFEPAPTGPNYSQRVKRKYPALDNEIPLVAGDKKRVLAVTAHRNNAKARLMEKESKKYLQAQQANVFEDHFAHEDSQVPSSFRLSGSSAAVLSSTSSSANAPPGYRAPPATALPPKASGALRSDGQRR